MLTANGEPAMPPNERLNGGKLDLVIFADQFTLGVSSKRPKAIGTMRRLMILNGIGRFAQFTRMAFVSGLGAAGLGLLAPLFSIRRWRFGRRARSLVRTLKPKHQLDQIVLAQPLQIIAIHPNLESATRPTRKGWVITVNMSPLPECDWRFFAQASRSLTTRRPRRRFGALLELTPPTETFAMKIKSATLGCHRPYPNAHRMTRESLISTQSV